MIKTRKKDFLEYIEHIVRNGDVSYMEAIVQYCRDRNVEMESVIPLISKSIKERLEAEAIDLNWIKSNTHTLPLDE